MINTLKAASLSKGETSSNNMTSEASREHRHVFFSLSFFSLSFCTTIPDMANRAPGFNALKKQF